MIHQFSKSKKRFSIAFVSLSFFLMGLLWTLLPTVANVLIGSDKFSLQPSQYGVLEFVLIISAIISSAIAAFLGKREGLKKVLLASLLFLGIAGLFFAVANFRNKEIVFKWLFCGEVFLGLGIGGLFSSCSAYLPLLIANKTALLLTGVYFFINLGSSVMPFLFHFLFRDTEWWIMSSVSSFLIFFLFGIGMLLLPDQRNMYAGNGSSLFQCFRGPSPFWLLFATMLFYAIVENATVAWSPVYLHAVNLLTIGQGNLGLSLFWMTVGIGQLSICIVMRWVKPLMIYRALPLFITVGYYGLYGSKTLSQELTFFILAGFGCSAFFALTVSLIEKRFRVHTEMTTGILVMSYFTGYAVSSGIFAGLLRYALLDLSNIYFYTGGLGILLFLLVNFPIANRYSDK